MTALAQLTWDDGVLRTSGPDLPPHSWTRPAALAEARLALVSPPADLVLADGGDLLTAAFAVLPFARGALPPPAFGPAATSAARAAFLLLAGLDGGGPGEDFRVLRGEVGDFIVFARLRGGAWSVGALTVQETTLTVRFEDLWELLPARLKAMRYRVDAVSDRGELTLDDVSPDARITLDLAADGGFTLVFRPDPAGEGGEA